MNDSVQFDVEHVLHGADVFDPESFEYVGMNFLVHKDGHSMHVGWGTVTNDVGVFHGKVDDVMTKIEDEGWEVHTNDTFIDQAHELKEAVESGEF